MPVSMSRAIFITDSDKEKLQKLIRLEQEFNADSGNHLDDLNNELERAVIVQPQEVPDNVITMNSQVVLKDLDDNEEMIYTLVYPDDANLTENKISVMAPIGTAILGYRVGDVLEWKIPKGTVRLRVEKLLFQPEASGNFEL